MFLSAPLRSGDCNSVFNNFRTLYNNQFCTRFRSKNLNTFEYSFNLHSNIRIYI